MPQYTQEELQKLFDTLPEELKDALLSEGTAERISEICQRYEIKEKEVPEIAKMVGNVLMGLLPPEEFRESLEKKLFIDKERAENISREVNRFILFPVKESLAEFYREIRFAPGGRITKPEKKISKEKEEIEVKEEKEPGTDIYREPVE